MNFEEKIILFPVAGSFDEDHANAVKLVDRWFKVGASKFVDVTTALGNMRCLQFTFFGQKEPMELPGGAMEVSIA